MNSANARNLMNHSSMNWEQYKDYLCRGKTLVSFTRKMMQVISPFYYKYIFSLNSVRIVKKNSINNFTINNFTVKCTSFYYFS